MCLLRPVGDDLRIIIKKGDQHRHRHIQYKTDQFGQGHAAQNTEPRTFFDTVVLPRTEVLADECRQGH